jgi:transposase InsO family protein
MTCSGDDAPKRMQHYQRQRLSEPAHRKNVALKAELALCCRSQVRREFLFSIEAQVLIEAWRRHFNAVRPHSALGRTPPAPERVVLPAWPARITGKLESEAAMN